MENCFKDIPNLKTLSNAIGDNADEIIKVNAFKSNNTEKHASNLILKRSFKQALKMLDISISMYLISKSYSQPSRRLSNMGYLSWVLILQSIGLCFGYFFAIYFSGCIGNMTLLSLISKGMLEIFLVSNLCILFAKMAYDLKKMSFISGNALFIFYLIVNLLGIPKLIQFRQHLNNLKYKKMKSP